MARSIDLSKSLSDAEKQYLIDRERWRDLEQNAEATGDPMPSRTTGISAQAQSTRIGDQTVTRVPDGSNPAPASLGQRQRAAADGGGVQLTFETDDHPYEDWSKEDLQNQNDRRGLAKSGNKQALADRLRDWDEENRPESGSEEDEDESDSDDGVEDTEPEGEESEDSEDDPDEDGDPDE